MRMELVADRFVTLRDEVTVDLAMGWRVVLRITRADAATDVEWSAGCGALARLRHPAIAPLVDYGRVGRDERFEAWQCGPSWNGAPREAARACDAATSFLAAAGFARATVDAVHVQHGTPVVLPSIGDAD